jgi:hypothetical protein
MRNGLISAVAIITLAVRGAQAGTVTKTRDIIIMDGFDVFGLCGPLNGNLVGDTALLESDSLYSQPQVNGEQYADSTGDDVLSESITINSQTFTIKNPSVAYVGGYALCAAGLSDLFIENRSVPTFPNTFLLFNFSSDTTPTPSEPYWPKPLSPPLLRVQTI